MLITLLRLLRSAGKVPGTNPGVGIFTRASNPRRWKPLSNGNDP